MSYWKKLALALITALAVVSAGATPGSAAFESHPGVCETTTSTGDTTVELTGSPAIGGYVTFADRYTSGATVSYMLTTGLGGSRKIEVGQGTFTDGSPDTLSRDTVYMTTDDPDGGTPLTLAAGTHTICTGPIPAWFQLGGGSTSWSPNTDAGAALGTSSLGWADVFLSDGGALDWNNGECRLEQDGTTLETDGCTLSQKSLNRAGELVFLVRPELPDQCLWPDGSTVSRATYPVLLDAITVQLTGDTTDTSPTITSASKDVSVLGLVGAKVEGAGIPSSTTILSATDTTITLSNNATATASGVALRIFPHGNGDESTTFTLPDARGRVAAIRDSVGGTSANRLTGANGSINGDNLATVGGTENVTIVQANLPDVSFTVTNNSHTHTFSDTTSSDSHSHTYTRYASITTRQTGSGNVWNSTDSVNTSSDSHSHTTSGTTSGPSATSGTAASGGSDTPLATLQPTLVVNACIATGAAP